MLITTRKLKYDKTYGLYMLDCKASIPDLKLDIGAKTYSLTSKNMIVPVTSTKCGLAIEAFNGGGLDHFELEAYSTNAYTNYDCEIHYTRAICAHRV
ncbi:hypothetical protein PRIPAC_73768 [Pristionchus pacificus]|uniref:Uncharacterized protein n=1 Tax=Pristionchus pacificus TaxID=54126 RepID=A0A2A6C0W5_PRIPA|nr:hypothetical protein PRIPAC_73768 [Pristionchus pacificus]|eukprot:PDM71805.1 hypothetical protein PRIPAC_38212 [Pristionchus pacificus]